MAEGLEDVTDVHGVGSPDRIEYGMGATERLGAFAADRGVDRALLVTDADLSDAGVVDAPREALESTGVSVDVFDGVKPEPKLRMAEEAGEQLRDGGHDLVVGVGGGSSMDTAKVASVLAEHDDPVREMLGMGNVPGEGRPLALLPTTAGTGSEVTHIGVFADEEDGGNKKVIYSEYMYADLATVDPELTRSMPRGVAAATGMDALTHAVEAYTSVLRTPYTDVLARRSMELVAESLRPAVHQGAHNDRARYDMCLAATLGGQAFVNSGLGAVHALTYPLGMELDLGHGLANAVLLPYVMAYNAAAEPERYAEVARLLDADVDPDASPRAAAEAGVEAVRSLNEDVGIPTTISAFGDLDIEDFERFAEVCFEHSEHNIERNPRALDRGDVVQIFENAYEGTY